MDNADGLSLKTKRLILLAVLVVIVLVVMGFVSALQRRGKVAIQIRTAPKEAIVTIDGKKTSKSVSLAPGNYTFVISYPGFASYTEKLELKSGDGERVFSAALTPQTPAAKQLADTQLGQYRELEKLGGQEAQKDGENFLKNNPILGNIPTKTSYYSIDYGRDASGDIVIQITASQPLGRQVALEKIRSWGYDPTDYKLVFVGLVNPFRKATN